VAKEILDLDLKVEIKAKVISEEEAKGIDREELGKDPSTKMVVRNTNENCYA